MTYEMLCGVRPFVGETDIDVLHAIQRVPPPPLADRRRDLPPELVVAIEKAIEKEPVDRYQSMSTEDRHRSIRDLVQLLDEHSSLAFERLDHMAIVDNLVTHVDGSAELLEGAVDDVNCPHNAGAEAPRLSQ